MAAWPSRTLLRLGAAVMLGLFATATLTYAAQQRIHAATASKPAVTPPAQDTLVVPNVEGQVYVFAEGILEDAGFGWRVAGANGFASNRVVAQSPAPGTKVVDTGAPLVTVSLSSSKRVKGTPVNASPYTATPIKLPGTTAAAPTQTTAAPTPAATPKAAAAKTKAKTKTKAKAQPRTPDFVVPGAPKEPTDEMPLVNRAQLLGKWLDTHKTNTNANVQHWLYQNAWVVTGAKFGWWHGAAALRVLIDVDRRAEALWGIGAKSESVARAALAEVETRAH
jgi:PASTA domain-containing protein